MAVSRASIDPSISAVSKTAEGFGATCINVVNTTYTWTIYNFTACDEKVGLYLTSPIFMGAGPDESLVWNIILYPYNKTVENKDYMSMYLQLVNPRKKAAVRARSVFSFVNALNKQVNVAQKSKYDLYDELTKSCWGYDKFMAREDLKNRRLLQNDNLTIVVEVSVVLDTVNIVGKRHALDIPKSRVLEDLSTLYESKKYCDVTLVAAGGRKFRAHKAILAARSPVFSAMFDHDMVEARSNTVEITDIDGATIAAMLRFLYTDQTIELHKVAAELMAAANKYDLGRLKILCEESLCNDLTVENVASRLFLSEVHSALHLKARAIDLIHTRKKDVMATAGYKAMCDSHPAIINEAVKKGDEIHQTNGKSNAATTNPDEVAKTRGRKRTRDFILT